MTGNVTMIKTGGPPARTGGFIETESAKAMLTAMRRVRAMGKLTMIIAAPGTGKTAAKFHFRHTEAPETILLDIAPGEGGIWGLVCALYRRLELGDPDQRRLPEARHCIAEAIGPDGFLMIDEAQYLIKVNDKGKDNYEAFEWLRMVKEEGGFGVVLIGDTTLDQVLNRYPQLKRRTHPRVRISGSTERDVKAFCADRGLSDESAVKGLCRCAKHYGGLGAVTEVFEMAQDMSTDDAPTLDDFLAAIQMFERGL